MLHETISTRDPVALLVDGENFHADLAAPVLAVARGLGRVNVLRVYGQTDQIKAWDDHGFRMCPTRPGKNSADMLLCVQAMSLALRDEYKTIVIASSDRDFTYLAEELRELGVTVIGVGSPDAALSFQNSCSRFDAMGEARVKVVASVAVPAPFPAPAPATAATTKAKPPPDLASQVRDIIAAQGNGKGIEIAALNGAVHKVSSLRISSTPEKSWRRFLMARPNLFRCDAVGPNAKVYLKACPPTPPVPARSENAK